MFILKLILKIRKQSSLIKFKGNNKYNYGNLLQYIMEYTFLIPTILSVVSLVWNYIQNRKILDLKSEAERKNLIHRYQFEKEFSIYTDLWAKLIDLRNTTASLRPGFRYY